jgi:Txe/YoeB family toxin of Txe-Axe toxin-antitoxin module
MKLFNAEDLDLVTEAERKILSSIDSKVQDYFDGKVKIEELKGLGPTMSHYARRIHARTPIAMIQYDKEKRELGDVNSASHDRPLLDMPEM